MPKTASRINKAVSVNVMNALIVALHRQMPVENCHKGRGWGHSEACYRSCFDSWERTVREIAFELSHLDPAFDKQAWVDTVTNGIRSEEVTNGTV